ncbi:MAG: hypothetical protein ACE5F1_03170 [Planctomycetota bacterium]
MTRADDPRGGLRREVLALLLVYLALTVLPLLAGFACHGDL